MECHWVFESCASEDQVGYVRSAQLATCQVSDDDCHAWLMAIALIADGKVSGRGTSRCDVYYTYIYC